ncbi:MAG: thymidine phosphorylase, partial [Brachybacterium sp.]|nr:thymidine phosphorylase [Brachybacterium sp.]
LLTDMSAPLGRTAGNAVEVAESVEVLAGGGPADVVELTVALAAEMLDSAGRPTGTDDIREALADGRAMDTWRAMIAAQGGDPDAELPRARHVEEYRASADGVVTGLDAMGVGVAAWRLGAGRSRPGEDVQAAAGVVIRRHLGEQVKAGDVLAELHTDTEDRIDRAREALDGAWTLSTGSEDGTGRAIVLDRITAD